MDAGSILYEVDGIDKELSRLRKKMNELTKRKKELMVQAIDYMQESGETTIEHRGKTYVLEERSRHVRKNDKKKREDTMLILQEEGFDGVEAEEIYTKITDALRGPETRVYALKK